MSEKKLTRSEFRQELDRLTESFDINTKREIINSYDTISQYMSDESITTALDTPEKFIIQFFNKKRSSSFSNKFFSKFFLIAITITVFIFSILCVSGGIYFAIKSGRVESTAKFRLLITGVIFALSGIIMMTITGIAIRKIFKFLSMAKEISNGK